MPGYTAQETLEYAANVALEYYDKDDTTGALAAFLSEIGKHEDTRLIQTGTSTLMILRVGMSQGREAFKKAMLNFSVIDH
jgi:hypothetical protein